MNRVNILKSFELRVVNEISLYVEKNFQLFLSNLEIHWRCYDIILFASFLRRLVYFHQCLYLEEKWTVQLIENFLPWMWSCCSLVFLPMNLTWISFSFLCRLAQSISSEIFNEVVLFNQWDRETHFVLSLTPLTCILIVFVVLWWRMYCTFKV